MSATENRVVKMIFDNDSFKRNASDTQKQLADIDKAVATSGKGRGLLDLAGHMETVKVKAGAMQVAAVTAIANIANKAVNAGINMAKSLSLDPLKQGFDEYELKMKSIQTILSNTKGENLKSVSASLNELNTYADKTIYNFANMTQNIGKLTTAGVSLNDATSTVKGFSNMVALAGGDANAAAGAMEQFGQGIQAGVIKLIDWKSLQTRGLGSQSLQKAFFETARAAGSLKDVPLSTTFEEWSKSQGGFNQSLESGWLTADTAVETMSIMAGEITTVKQLMDKGFSEAVAKDMLQIAKNAEESATKVRTFSAFWGTFQEQLGSGWSQIIEVVVGDFNEATDLFTAWSDATGNALGKVFGYLERLLKGWDKMGGRVAVIQAFKNVLAPIGAILKVIAKAWQAAFPGRDTGGGLAAASKGLEMITRPLAWLAELISRSQKPITSFFKLFNIGATLIKNTGARIAEFAKELFGLVSAKFGGGGGGGIVDFFKDAGNTVASVIDQVDKLVAKGASLKEAFSKIKFDMPGLPDFGSSIKSLGKLEDVVKQTKVGDQFKSLTGIEAPDTSFDKAWLERQKLMRSGALTDPKANAASLKGMLSAAKAKTSLSSIEFNPDADITGGRVRDADDPIVDYSDRVKEGADKLKESGGTLTRVLDWIKERFKSFVDNFNFDDLMASFNLAVLSAFFIRASQMMKSISDGVGGFGGAMEGITNALSSFQTQARAKMITAIAIAVGVLAASIWVLSRIPEKDLKKALLALAGIAAVLRVTLTGFSKTVENLEGKGINLKMIALGASMVLLAIAVTILASGMKKFNDVDWQSVIKGAVAMGLLKIAMDSLAKINAPGIFKTSLALVVIGGALMIFVKAIQMFAKLDPKTFGEGLVYITATLAILVTLLKGFQSSVGGAIAMIIVAGALSIFYHVIQLFAKLDWKTFGEGLAYVALTLLVLVVALKGFQSSMAGAIAMVIAVGALRLMFEVIQMFATLDWKTFLKALGMLALVLVVLGLAFAGFLAIMSIFTPVLVILSGFVGSIALLALAITGLTLAFAAIFPILAGGAAVFLAFATGAAVAFAVFMTTLAAEAPIIKKAFLDILQVIIDSIVEAVPMIIDGVKRLFKAVKDQFSGGESGKTKALMGKESGSWIDKIKDTIKEKIPLIVEKARDLIIDFIGGLAKHAKKIGQKGAELVGGLIAGVASRIGGIVESAVTLIVNFANALGGQLDTIVTAGINLVANFLHALANGIRNGSGKIAGGLKDVGKAFFDVGKNAIQGLIDGIKSLAEKPKEWIADIVGSLPKWAKKLLGIASPSKVFANIGKFLVDGLTQGIQTNAKNAIIAVASMVGGQIAMASSMISDMVQKLDQASIAATAKAVGLAAAAEKANKAAEKAERRAAKTKKNKADDAAARKLQKRADKIQREADRAATRAEREQEKVAKAEEAAERAEVYRESSTLEKAKMRSEDAQTLINEAKAYEMEAGAKAAEAAALDKLAQGPGLSKSERKKMKADADRARTASNNLKKKANAALDAARTAANEALALQVNAGAEAAAEYDRRFNREAQMDAEEDEFNKLEDADKAIRRRQQADELQKQANRDLAAAKALAYTDLEAANELAEQAMANADLARDYIREAVSLEERASQGTGASTTTTGGSVVNLDPTEAAALAFNRYAELYDRGTAAAAAGQHVEFNQYNTSPEALNPVEIYRQTNNQFSHAVQRLEPAA